MAEGARILIVDDDPDILHLIGLRLSAAGYRVTEATSGEEAMLGFRESRPQLVITDLKMGGMDGLALFDHLQSAAPTLPVIILTAHGTIPDAVSATRRGVFSFLTKPFDGQELMRRVADAIRLSPSLEPDRDSASWRQGVISINVRMEELLRQALRIAQEGRATLLVGPPGCGKTALAKAIHRAGERAQEPFVTVSCTDYPAGELEAMLAPNGVDAIFGPAGKGVLFLQDIAALSPLAQSRLFSALFGQMQARDPLYRLRSAESGKRAPEAQVIASCPRPLDIAVAEGSFRSDLFYLLSGTALLIPPLSERAEDIPLLASHFLSTLRSGDDFRLAPDALIALGEGSWPGNVRQLRNVLERAIELSLTPVIPEALVRKVMRECEEESLLAFDDARRDFERDYLVRLLRTTAGNVAHAARIAQRNRTEFYKLLARHGLDPASFKQSFR